MLEMARAANGQVFGLAADYIFSGWISPSRPLMLKKTLKFFELEELLGGDRSE